MEIGNKPKFYIDSAEKDKRKALFEKVNAN